MTLSLGERGSTPLYLGIASVMVTTVAYRVSLTAWRLVMSLTSYFREKAAEIRKRSEELRKQTADRGRARERERWMAWYQEHVEAGRIDPANAPPPRPGTEVDFPEGK